jgi:hypothetical protein
MPLYISLEDSISFALGINIGVPRHPYSRMLRVGQTISLGLDINPSARFPFNPEDAGFQGPEANRVSGHILLVFTK